VQIAATVPNDLAWRVINGDIGDFTNAEKSAAKEAFDDLVRGDAVFGYDGFQESGCAEPTDSCSQEGLHDRAHALRRRLTPSWA
jgi:hypothetical protein